MSVRCDSEETMENNKIKPQETRGFDVENPSNAEGKNQGRQPANLHYIEGEYLQRLAAAYKRNNPVRRKP